MKIVNLLPEHFIEHDYFNLIVENLDKEKFKDRIIILTDNYERLPVYGDDIIVLLTAGPELAKLPLYNKKVRAIFKHHMDQEVIENVYHMPLTYSHNFKGNTSTPIEKRKHDVFFSGSRTNRIRFEQEFKKLQSTRKDLNIYANFYDGWMHNGLKLEEYAEKMSNSKIIISPHGQVRCECVRFTEAVKCGAAIIAPEHPDCKAFRECPAVYIKGWKGTLGQLDMTSPDHLTLSKAIDFCLDNLGTIHDKMKQSWCNNFSPKAASKLIENAE